MRFISGCNAFYTPTGTGYNHGPEAVSPLCPVLGAECCGARLTAMDDRPTFLRCFLFYVPILATLGALVPIVNVPTSWHWYSGALAGGLVGVLFAIVQYEAHGEWGD